MYNIGILFKIVHPYNPSEASLESDLKGILFQFNRLTNIEQSSLEGGKEGELAQIRIMDKRQNKLKKIVIK